MELDARMAAYQTGIQSGVLTINEARKLEELEPMEGGDEPLVQMQYRPLSMAGQPATAPPAPPAEPPAPADPDEPDAEMTRMTMTRNGTGRRTKRPTAARAGARARGAGWRVAA